MLPIIIIFLALFFTGFLVMGITSDIVSHKQLRHSVLLTLLLIIACVFWAWFYYLVK